MAPLIEAYIISWVGQNERADALAAQLKDSVAKTTIIYSDDRSPDIHTTNATWARVPDAWFYGAKFRAVLDRFRGDVLLQVTADVRCDNWRNLVRRLAECSRMNLGVWSPIVDFSSYRLERVGIEQIRGTSLYHVTNTDSIVWAMTAPIADRMRRLDYSMNNMGWGIDQIAALHSHAIGKLVVMDTDVRVDHPPSRGYNKKEARRQCRAFMRQMTIAERFQQFATTRALRKYPALRRPLFWSTRKREFRQNQSIGRNSQSSS